MSVKNETVQTEAQEIVDDISSELIKETQEEEDTLAALKAKMAAKKAKDSNKEEEKKMPIKIVEEKKRALKIGIIGSGQCGSRIAQAFYKMSYPCVVLNTAQQDLEFIDVPQDLKLLLDYGVGGTAKNTDLGAEAAEAYRDAISSLIDEKLSDSQLYILCLSLGGGSGAGSCKTLVDILTNTGKPIVVITVLPLTTEDAQVLANSLVSLSLLSKMVQAKQIANLIVVDNSKIETIYSEVSQMDFFKVSNQAIVEPIDVFNRFSVMPSDLKSLDPMEFAKLFTDGEGLSTYGELVVSDYTEPTSIAEAVIENLNNGLLASGFDLSTAKYVGVLFIGNSKVMSNIASQNINYAMSIIKEQSPGADAVFRGTYVDDSIKEDELSIYSFFSGLGLPTSRVDQLKIEAQKEAQKAKGREQTRNLHLQLDTGTEATVSAAEKVKEMIKKKGSNFGKNFAGGQKDFRKK
jgi:cell division GTPase FtsZ